MSYVAVKKNKPEPVFWMVNLKSRMSGFTPWDYTSNADLWMRTLFLLREHGWWIHIYIHLCVSLGVTSVCTWWWGGALFHKYNILWKHHFLGIGWHGWWTRTISIGEIKHFRRWSQMPLFWAIPALAENHCAIRSVKMMVLFFWHHPKVHLKTCQ